MELRKLFSRFNRRMRFIPDSFSDSSDSLSPGQGSTVDSIQNDLSLSKNAEE